jgi:hypothetical protein
LNQIKKFLGFLGEKPTIFFKIPLLTEFAPNQYKASTLTQNKPQHTAITSQQSANRTVKDQPQNEVSTSTPTSTPSINSSWFQVPCIDFDRDLLQKNNSDLDQHGLPPPIHEFEPVRTLAE